MTRTIVSFLRDQSGTSAIEYCVMTCFMSLVVVGAAQVTGLRVALTLRHLVALMVFGHANLAH